MIQRLCATWGVVVLAFAGCSGAKVEELRGRTALGPEFRNRGDNTHETRYDTRQGLELRWDNGWTTSVLYRYRAVDEGSGDAEHLTLFEVGYPLWKAPRKSDPTTARIAALEKELAGLREQLRNSPSGQAGAGGLSANPPVGDQEE